MNITSLICLTNMSSTCYKQALWEALATDVALAKPDVKSQDACLGTQLQRNSSDNIHREIFIRKALPWGSGNRCVSNFLRIWPCIIYSALVCLGSLDYQMG